MCYAHKIKDLKAFLERSCQCSFQACDQRTGRGTLTGIRPCSRPQLVMDEDVQHKLGGVKDWQSTVMTVMSPKFVGWSLFGSSVTRTVAPTSNTSSPTKVAKPTVISFLCRFEYLHQTEVDCGSLSAGVVTSYLRAVLCPVTAAQQQAIDNREG